MDSFTSLSSNVVMLREFLWAEKEDTRRWLRAEMDRLVDPMLDSMFDKITNKLMNKNWGGCVDYNRQTLNPFYTQVHQPYSQISQPTTSVTPSFNAVFHQPNSSNNEEEYDLELLAQVKQEIEDENEMELKNVMDKVQHLNKEFKQQNEEYEEEEEEYMNQLNPQYSQTDHLFQNTNVMDNAPNQQFERQIEDEIDEQEQVSENMNNQVNHQSPQSHQVNSDWDEPEIEEERGGGQNNIDKEIEIIEESTDQLELIASNQTHNPTPSLTNASTSSNERHSNNNLTNSETEKEEDQVIKEKVAEDIENGKSPFDKTIETTPPYPSGQSTKRIMKIVKTLKRKETHDERQQPNEVNNRDNQEDIEEEYDNDEATSRSVKRSRPFRPITSSSSIQENQIITLNLRCPKGCGKMFAKDDFHAHMWKRHSILPFRCPVKDCAKSFENSLLLGQHIAHSHKHTTLWHCDKCDTKYTSYLQLSNHNILYHHLGEFQCSFHECPFTGDHRKKVYNHYAQQHKATLNCQHCEFRTMSMTNLKKHQLIHSDCKPY